MSRKREGERAKCRDGEKARGRYGVRVGSLEDWKIKNKNTRKDEATKGKEINKSGDSLLSYPFTLQPFLPKNKMIEKIIN